jgi:two-component system sensor histidine kinase SenX3
MSVGWFVAGIVVASIVAYFISRKKTVTTVQAAPVVPVAPVNDSLTVHPLASAMDALPIGVVVAVASAEHLVRNTIASAMTGIRHVDVLVDQAVESLLAQTFSSGNQERALEVAGPPTRHFSIRTEMLSGGNAVAVIEDVTQRVLIDTVRTDFVANLSHELKTPIGGIAALGDTMTDETDPVVIQQLAERIVKESFRMSGIVDDLLSLSRIEFGKSEDWQPVAVSSVLREAVGQCQHMAQRHHVEISLDCENGAFVFGDRSQLVSALSNLIENAVKYSEADKLVRIETKEDAETVAITVADQGIGIAPADQERIFERFFRVDRARSRSTGGTGLGLSIVRHVVDNHGGKISVQSEEGKGAIFTVSLPTTPQEAIPTEESYEHAV